MKEKLLNLTQLQALKPEYLEACDAFSIPVKCGVQALTVIEATPAHVSVMAMKRESGPACRRLYKRHRAVWVN